MTVLVTGANGFVGRPLCALLAGSGHDVAGSVRGNAVLPEGVARRPSPGLSVDADWAPVLEGVRAVVHLAARVHVMQDGAVDPLAEFREANRDATLCLAEQAQRAGVGHLVYLSSIKACGEETFGAPFGPADGCPVDPYGRSKLEAEVALANLATRTGLGVTILRPPLVYGPGVKGNFRSLLSLLDRRLPLPLPFGMVDNRRSLICVENLCDAVRVCLESPSAPGQTRVFTLCDGETVSTARLVRLLATALDRSAILLPVPVGWMRLAGRLLGKEGAVQRLCGSLEVSLEAMAATLGWTPPVSLEYGLEATARWWRSEKGKSA